jgi:hypothetical protein
MKFSLSSNPKKLLVEYPRLNRFSCVAVCILPFKVSSGLYEPTYFVVLFPRQNKSAAI